MGSKTGISLLDVLNIKFLVVVVFVFFEVPQLPVLVLL